MSKLRQIVNKIIIQEMRNLKEGPENFNSLKTRLVAALTKTEAASYGGMFDDEKKQMFKDAVAVLKKATPEDQIKIVELEEQWAKLMTQNPGRPAPDSHPVMQQIEKIYKKYI